MDFPCLYVDVELPRMQSELTTVVKNEIPSYS